MNARTTNPAEITLKPAVNQGETSTNIYPATHRTINGTIVFTI